MRDEEQLYRGRLGRVLEELLAPAIYPAHHRLEISAWQVPDEPVSFADALTQTFEPFTVGSRWGRAWSTVWFHITGQVPTEWLEGTDVEIVIDLGFREQMEGGQAEGLAYRPDGSIIKAIEPFNRYLPVEDREHGVIDIYLEAAANPEVAVGGTWHLTLFSSKDTVPDEPIYVLRQLDVAVRDQRVWELNQDIEVLAGLVDELPRDLPRRAEIISGLDRAMDALDPDDIAGSVEDARAVLRPILDKPAYASAHRVLATGHAHIDSAWLWPIRETVRKCARTFANVMALMDENEGMVFSCSSAQQYAWIKQYYPQLWDRLKIKVAEGRFVPVGGMWVESDTNMPGSEAMARQFIMGKNFFLEEFGVDTEEVWLPDSFGYSGALPQIAKAAGARWFLTQKLSWNETNAMPHHTFQWEGIDGTRIFTHMPPADTYNSTLSAAELARAERQYTEHGHGTTSLIPFGYGDGGGGPTREMLAKAERTADLEGSPTVRIGTSEDFFTDAESELANPHVWTGELYLENHRGTYTSQLRTKQGNRRTEHLLRAAEIWATTAAVRAGVPYPSEELRKAWETLLLLQFHDILPGCSIAWVHREAEASYARVQEALEPIISRSLEALAGTGDMQLVVNSAPQELDGVAPLAVESARLGGSEHAVSVEEVGSASGGYVIDNGVLCLRLSSQGLLTSVFDHGAQREVVPDGQACGLLQIHNDRPTLYEAWDIDAHYRRTATDLTDVDVLKLLRSGPDVVTVLIVRTLGESTISEELSLRAGSRSIDLTFDIDWHESRRLLKLAFPTDCHADRAASEIQFGHIYRPTHQNTSWDVARFETCAHRWVHIAEPGFGIAVANDSTYGHDIRRESYGPSAAVGTTVRLSLLRGPKFPDPQTDQGNHRMAVSLVVGTDIEGAIRAGQRLNQPLRFTTGAQAVAPLLEVDNPGVLIETIKPAQDGSGDVVVRLYEALGQRSRAVVKASFAFHTVIRTDLLERDLPDASEVAGPQGTAALDLHPFQIVTLRYSGVHG